MKTTYKFVDLSGDPITVNFPPPNVVIPCDMVSVEFVPPAWDWDTESEMVVTLMYRHDLPTTDVGKSRVMKRYREG